MKFKIVKSRLFSANNSLINKQLNSIKSSILLNHEILSLSTANNDDIFALFNNEFINEFPKFKLNKEGIDNITLSKLLILIKNKELNEKGFKRLCESDIFDLLPCSSLVSMIPQIITCNHNIIKNHFKTILKKVNNVNELSKIKIHYKQLQKQNFTLQTQVCTRIAVLGNCNLRNMVDFLEIGMLQYEIDTILFEAGYNQWINQLQNTESELYSFNPSFLIFYMSSLGLQHIDFSKINKVVSIILKSILIFRKKSAAKIIFVLPEPLEEEYLLGTISKRRLKFCNQIQKNLIDKVVFYDPSYSIMRIGAKNYFANRYWFHGKIPCHPNGLIDIGKALGLTICRMIIQPVKVIVCDLDNTLWGGIVGEDGFMNIKLDKDTNGGPFIKLQLFLKTLQRRGILLAIVSKNNLKDVEEVFEKREEMILKNEDFIDIIANWSSKSENIQHLANRLNIGLKNFCFIDDSQYEREEVRYNLPDVIVPDLGDSPDEYLSNLLKTGLFNIPTVTNEDKQRQELYKSNMKREIFMKNSRSPDSYLKQLKIKLFCYKISDENIERCVQLINKTNQFNLTAVRYDFSSMNKVIANEKNYCFCYHVKDEFGDNGIVGLLIAKQSEEMRTYLIDTWVLSCRVMGRTIEFGVFQHLYDWLKIRQIQLLIGEYKPTPKNLPVKNLYKGLGFRFIRTSTTGTISFKYDLSTPFFHNKYIRIIE